MIIFLANIVAIAAVGFLVLRRGRDQRDGSIRSAHWLRIAGFIPLGLQVAILLLFGIGEMASGDLSGAGHLLQVAVTALLGILAWMRPLEGGVALFGGAALFIVGFIVGVVTSVPLPESTVISPAIMIMAAPQIVSGVLFFIAGMLARSATTPGADQGK
jgi:hypothetical protein